MYKNEGIRGIYNGSLSNAIRSLGGSLILVLFDDFKKISMNIINKKKHWQILNLYYNFHLQFFIIL